VNTHSRRLKLLGARPVGAILALTAAACLSQTVDAQRALVVTGVDWRAFCDSVGLADAPVDLGATGIHAFDRTKRQSVSVRVYRDPDLAHEAWAAWPDYRQVATLDDPTWPVGDESDWRSEKRVVARVSNVVFEAGGPDGAATRELARQLAELVASHDDVAPKGDAVPALRVAFRHPARAREGEPIEISYAVSDQDEVYISGRVTPQPPRATWKGVARQQGVEPGYYTDTIWFASPMCVVTQVRIRIRILPAEDGGG
jgi:hypothetical protein